MLNFIHKGRIYLLNVSQAIVASKIHKSLREVS